MAATYAEAIGVDSSRTKTTHRFGSKRAIGKAQTFRTFAEVVVEKDGSVYVSVKRDGILLHEWSCGPEV